MVRGLDKFREYFKGYEDNYVVIGGTACDVILNEAGLTPRATKDIDLVIIVEALTKEFVAKFWEFVVHASYQKQEKGMEKRMHYRFMKPLKEDFPFQVELFSRVPDLIELGQNQRFTPIPVEEGLSSLSAIIMDDDYYALTVKHAEMKDGLKCASEISLICLKAKAFLNLSAQEAKGERVDTKHIKKHKSDVFRIALMLTEDTVEAVPASVKKDLQEFVDRANEDLPGPEMFNELGAAGTDPRTLIQQLEWTFGLDHDMGAHTDRKIAAAIRKQTGKKDVSKTRLDLNSATRAVRESILPLLKDLEQKCETLRVELFNDYDRELAIRIGGHERVSVKEMPWPEIEARLLDRLAAHKDSLFMAGIDYNYQFRGNKKSLRYSHMAAWIQFQFSEYSYSVRLHQDMQNDRAYSYDAPLDKAEIDLIVGELIDRVLAQIKEAGGLEPNS